MLQIKNTLGGGKPEGLYAWKKSEIGSELKEFNKSVSTLPYSFFSGCAVVLDGEIHILGSNITGGYKFHYKWNGSSWVSVSTLPYNFRNGSAVVLDGEIHILGTEDDSSASFWRYHYKWNGSSWVSVSTLPYGFYKGSAVVLNGEIHILGSGAGSTAYKYHYKWDGSSWTSVSTLPYNLYSGSAVVLDNEIHILGGDGGLTNHYKFDGTSWTSVSTLPYQFRGGSVVVFDNEMHILGGNGGLTNHYKFDGTSWTSVNTLPYNLYYGSVVIFDNGIHVLGTSNNGNYSKAHYLIIGYVPVYTFLDYIVSDKETAYPDGGEKGGYWYERVFDISAFGFTEYAIDTYIPTYDQEYTTIAGSTKGHKFSHSLGKEPKFAIVWCPSLMISNYYNTDKYYLASAEIGVRNPSSDDTGSKCFSIFSCTAQSSNTCKASYSTTALGYCLKSDYIWVQISNYFPYLKGGETYYIITLA